MNQDCAKQSSFDSHGYKKVVRQTETHAGKEKNIQVLIQIFFYLMLYFQIIRYLSDPSI